MFACNLRTTVPLCLQIETFEPRLYFKLQEGTEQSKSVVSGLQIRVIRGRLESDCAWGLLCCSVQTFHRILDMLVLEPCTLERAEPHRSGAVSVCPACRHFSLRSWLHLQMANAKLGLCSVPAPAPGQLFSTQRQTRRGRECASPFPLLAYLRKSFQLLLISSLPFLRTQKCQVPEGRRAWKRLQDGWCWPTGGHIPLRLWLLATVRVTSLPKENWWHLPDFHKALCCLLLPV